MLILQCAPLGQSGGCAKTCNKTRKPAFVQCTITCFSNQRKYRPNCILNPKRRKKTRISAFDAAQRVSVPISQGQAGSTANVYTA